MITLPMNINIDIQFNAEHLWPVRQVHSTTSKLTSQNSFNNLKLTAIIITMYVKHRTSLNIVCFKLHTFIEINHRLVSASFADL